ncbi:MAG: hypothetical protein ACM3NT_06630 [Methylocystaceae bacterium]
MFELNAGELAVLNRYAILNPQKQTEVLSYLDYLLFGQYREETVRHVLGNPFLLSGLSQVYQICQREDIGWDEVSAKVRQLKYMYYQLLEQVDNKYQELLSCQGGDTVVRDFGCYNFTALLEAVTEQKAADVLSQLEDMISLLQKYRKKSELCRIVAV